MGGGRAIVLAVLIACTACDTEAPSATYSLEETRRFGSMVELDSETAGGEAGGALLADIAGVFRSHDSTLFVLDRDYKKVVAFPPHAGKPRVLLGGLGDGPGEFRLPIDITPFPDGTLFSVLDYELGRSNRFGPDGFMEAVTLPRARGRQHVVRGDSIFVTRSTGMPSTAPIVEIYTLAGEAAGVGPPLSEEDQPFGPALGISKSQDGAILASTARPGVWMRLQGDGWERIGQPLFPEMPPGFEERLSENQIRATPSQATASSIGGLGDSLVFQGFTMLPEPFDWDDPPERGDFQAWLAIFTADGQHLQSIRLPGSVSQACMHVDNVLDRVLLCAQDPVPQVVEYRLTH